jgi:hypothetical protein
MTSIQRIAANARMPRRPDKLDTRRPGEDARARFAMERPHMSSQRTVGLRVTCMLASDDSFIYESECVDAGTPINIIEHRDLDVVIGSEAR